MRLNIGAGKKALPGYMSIDAAPPADLIADARNIPLDDGCAEEITAIHVWEHFHRWEVDDLAREWHRLLKQGGRLILEMPDIVKAARNLLDGTSEQLSYWAMYGDPRYENPLMCHKWAWTFATIKPFLEGHGFTDLVEKDTVFHGVGKKVRDFRVEAKKA